MPVADRLNACVVKIFGAKQHGDLFANARGTRMKLLVHDGFGVWCAMCCLNQGRFGWPGEGTHHVPSSWTCRGSGWNICRLPRVA